MIRITAFLLAFAAPTALAQTYLPPPEMVKEALDSAPALQAAEQLAAAARAEASALVAGPHEWAATGDISRRSVDMEGEFTEFEIGVARGIRTPGKKTADRQIGELGVTGAELAAEDNRHQLALMLMDHWTTWVSAEEMKLAAADQVAVFERDVEATQMRIASGDAPEIDLELARGALAEARVTAARSAGEAERASATLQALFPELVLPVAAPLIEAPPQIHAPESWIEIILSRSHEIEYFETLADLSDAQAHRARLDRLADPQLGLRTFSERNGDETGVGVFFSIPIGGGARRAASDKAHATASAARMNAQSIRRRIESMARENVITSQAERLAWTAASDAMNEMNAALSRMRKGYEMGAYGLSDLLVMERRAIEARRLEMEARLTAAHAWLRLNIDAHELWLWRMDH